MQLKGGIEFQLRCEEMSIKVLYVGECHHLIDKTLAQLEQIHTQIKNIQKSIEGIIALEKAFLI